MGGDAVRTQLTRDRCVLKEIAQAVSDAVAGVVITGAAQVVDLSNRHDSHGAASLRLSTSSRVSCRWGKRGPSPPTQRRQETSGSACVSRARISLARESPSW